VNEIGGPGRGNKTSETISSVYIPAFTEDTADKTGHRNNFGGQISKRNNFDLISPGCVGIEIA